MKPTAPKNIRTKAHTVRFGRSAMIKIGAVKFDFADPYHAIMSLSWGQLLAVYAASYIMINLVFGLTYWSIPGSVNGSSGSFADSFFFSVQTYTTIGYGVMSPATFAANVISMAEVMLGSLMSAVIIGVIFVRFSRPKGQILISDKIVISPTDGQNRLMIRVAYGRVSLLSDVTANLLMLREETSHDGKLFVTMHDLKLVRDRMQLLVANWYIMHVIDETSPLYGLDTAGLEHVNARFFLSMNGTDQTIHANVTAMKDYYPANVFFDYQFADMISEAPDGNRVIDLHKLSHAEPVVTDHR